MSDEWHLRFSYEEWVGVLDALEDEPTTAQCESAQDTLQRRAPRPWIDRVEARDSAR